MFNRLLRGRAQVRVLPGTPTTSHRAGVKTQRFLPDQTLCAAYRAALLALTDGDPAPYDPIGNPGSTEQRGMARSVADAVLMTIFGEEAVPCTYSTDWTDQIDSMHADIDTDQVWGVRYLAQPDLDTGDPVVSWHGNRHLAQAELDESESRPAVLVTVTGPVTTHQETIRY